ncbi:MAG: sugar phosphate isomerase/epimerase family protein, partial [Ferruginibacter sp.]
MINRREILQGFGASAALALLPELSKAGKLHQPSAKFTYSLNMATIRGHNLGFIQELEVASNAGFRAVEIWMDRLQAYIEKGGTLSDARKRIEDIGIVVENCIGFAPWIIEDPAKRRQGLDQMKREMDMLAQIGCKRNAALPGGATDGAVIDLKQVAERYRVILELGVQMGVIPQLEMWGFSKNLSRLSEVMFVALESGHPAARVLPDIFHMYKGGSSIETLPLVNSSAIEILHINDYPKNLSAGVITDADRIYPGDGVAPVKRMLEILQDPKRPLVISL